MQRKRINIWPYLLVLPALLIVTFVVFIPVIVAIFISFESYDLMRPDMIAYHGSQHFVVLFSDAIFWLDFKNTLILVVFSVGLQFLFGFILALLLNQSFRGRGIVRAVSLIPWATPGVLIGLMWKWIYDGNYGVLNDLLIKLGLIDKGITFLSQTSTAFGSVIV